MHNLWTTKSDEKRNGSLFTRSSDLKADETKTTDENKKGKKSDKQESRLVLLNFKGVNMYKFLYSIITKSKSTTENPFDMYFSENDAKFFLSMLNREGLLDNENSCVVCATDKLEQDLWELMKKQLEVTSMARKFYNSDTEQETKFNICSNHLSFAPNTSSTPKRTIPRTVPPPVVSPDAKSDSASTWSSGQSTQTSSSDQRSSTSPQNPDSPDSDYANNRAKPDSKFNRNEQENFPHGLNSDYFDAQFSESTPLNGFGRPSGLNSSYFPGRPENYFESDILPNHLFIPNPYIDIELPPSVSSNSAPDFNFSTPVPPNEVNFFPPSLVQPVSQNNYVPNRNMGQNFSNYAQNYFTQSTMQSYVSNNVVDDNLINQTARSYAASRLQAQMAQNTTAYLANRGIFTNNVHYNQQVAQVMNSTQSCLQQIVNNTVNDIERDMQEHVQMGQRVGRKILGKKY